MSISNNVLSTENGIDLAAATSALHTAISTVLEEEIPPLTPAMRLFEDLRMDSTTMLETLMALEESLGFEVDPEELDIEDFLTVKKYSSFIVGVCSK